MTSGNFSDFLTLYLFCLHLEQIYTIKFQQPHLLCLLFHDPLPLAFLQTSYMMEYAHLFMCLAPHPHPVHLGRRPEGALRAHEPVVLRRSPRFGRRRRPRRGERV